MGPTTLYIVTTLMTLVFGVAMGGVFLPATRNAIQGEYIVVLKKESAISDVDDLEAKIKTISRDTINVHSKLKKGVKGMTLGINKHLSATLQMILDDSRVDYVEEDSTVQLDENWGLDAIDLNPGNSAYDINGDGSGKTVYIIDSGIYEKHKQWNIDPTELIDCVDGNLRVTDCFGHGTHVAGIVGSNSHGVATKVQLSSVRIFDCQGAGTWGRVITGLSEIVSNGVSSSIINLSLSGGYSQAAADALEAANAAGFLLVASAGNGHNDACTVLPASSLDVLTVGATCENGSVWYYSNYGECVNIFAPGVQIENLDNRNPQSLTVRSGTSMAAPMVAGIAAVIWANNPSYTNVEVKNAILNRGTVGIIDELDSASINLFARL